MEIVFIKRIFLDFTIYYNGKKNRVKIYFVKLLMLYFYKEMFIIKLEISLRSIMMYF